MKPALDPLANLPVPPVVVTYKGYRIKRNAAGTAIIAVNLRTGHRLTEDFDNSIAAKNAIDVAVGIDAKWD